MDRFDARALDDHIFGDLEQETLEEDTDELEDDQ